MLEVKTQMKFSRGGDVRDQVDLRCVFCFVPCVWAFVRVAIPNKKSGLGDCDIW